MRGHEAIEALKQAGALNIVWGAGCSYATPEAARKLVFELSVNCKLPVKKPEETHEALKQLTRERRREVTGDWGTTWGHICLGELIRCGRAARVLTANFDNGLTKATTPLSLLPEEYEGSFPELAAAATPCIYRLGEAEPAVVAGLIERGAQTAPWLVIGASGDHFGLADGLRAVPRFEHGLYWVGYFDRPAPRALGGDFFSAARNAHFITGFDADSFLACFLRVVGEFPPAFVREPAERPRFAPAANGNPAAAQLYAWQNAYSTGVYKMRDGFAKAGRELLQKAGGLNGAGFHEAVEQANREFELNFRWSQSHGYASASFLATLASKRSPREGAPLFERALEWIARFPAAADGNALEANQKAWIYCAQARYRTGAEADELFSKAEQVLAAARQPRFEAYLAARIAEVLSDWVDQERGPDADAMFERARSKYLEAQKLEPKIERQMRYGEALRHRAGVVEGAKAAEILAAARAAVADLHAAHPNDAGILQYLGMLSIVEAEKIAARRDECLAEAGRLLGETARLRPDAAADILMNWATALGSLAMSRRGAEALEMYGRAEEKFRESEALQPDSRLLRKNWSSVLVRQARERGDAGTWERAKEQALKAEAIEAGSGAYNLACVAAEAGDREGVERWLLYSAEHGKIATLSHLLRDPNFQQALREPWFRALLQNLYGAGLPGPRESPVTRPQ